MEKVMLIALGFAVGFGAGWVANQYFSGGPDEVVMIDDGRIGDTITIGKDTVQVIVDSIGFKAGNVVTLQVEPRPDLMPIHFKCLGEGRGFVDRDGAPVEDAKLGSESTLHDATVSSSTSYFLYHTPVMTAPKVLTLRYSGSYWELD